MMRGHAKTSSRRDRLLLAVAATFLTVSSSAALAQAGTRTAEERAIDAAIPVPEPANVPPPTAADFKLDPSDAAPATTASTPPAETSPAGGDTAKAAPATVTEPARDAADETAREAAPEPTKAASAVPPADQPVADRLRDLLATKASRYFDRKADRAAVEAFYKARDFAPVWSEGGAATARAKDVIARLKNADADGLNPDDYPAPDFAAATSPEALAEAEFRLTGSVLDYARHAQSGRMHFSQVGGDILYPPHPPEPSEILTRVTSAAKAADALDQYNPPETGYRDLKAKLAELRGKTDSPRVRISEGPLLRYIAGKEMEDSRVPSIRARLGAAGDASDQRYDADVAEAVRKFQRENGLAADGVLGNRTLDVINGPRRANQIDTILVNMERWRWLPRNLGEPALGNAYVVLNIPDFTLRLKQGDATIWKTKVVVGKPGKHATPLLTDAMKFITVNPTWNVPPSIIYNEYLPALQQDPTVLDRMGLKLVQRADGSVHISQPPGDQNALGRIRFNFPNKFLVYMHDTPTKHLFNQPVRAYSHGCMRVQNPDQYAAQLLNIAMPGKGYTAERIRGMYGSSETNINFPTPIPVHLTYQTAFVDDAGHLEIRRDLYGHDAKMIALLKGSGGKNLEAVVAHAQPNYSRPRVTVPQGVASNERYTSPFGGGPNFFEALFGGFSQPQPPPPVDRRRIYTR